MHSELRQMSEYFYFSDFVVNVKDSGYKSVTVAVMDETCNGLHLYFVCVTLPQEYWIVAHFSL